MSGAGVTDWLILGALGGAALSGAALLVSRLAGEFAGRSVVAVGLIVASGAYFGFAVAAGAGTAWIVAEVAGCAGYGAMAMLGVRGSAWWLAAGWALHPLWDLPLHVFGAGASFAPAAYAVACLPFDLVVAGSIAVATWFTSSRAPRAAR